MDKSLKYYAVLMIRKNNKFYKKYNLPKGYKVKKYERGMEKDWARIEMSVGEFKSYESALSYFEEEFIASCEDLSEYCYFIEGPNGEIIGTASIWFGEHFNESIRFRLHWVAIHPDYQRRGLGKALVSHILSSNKLKTEDSIYLTTQSWSYDAIAMYLKFGFKPYCGSKPEGWNYCHMDFENYNNEAWELIWSKIG